ncbi:MAG TPA: N-formylglutamate deformylase [Woeseiaceae bacterium]|nr:N-formylglutamate deformylase [Woeseiaceae bacterium]
MSGDVYSWQPGDAPLLISIPHDGREIPKDIAARMTEAGRAIPDTDWHVRRLYEFAAGTGASVLAANYSRYVVDLNRSADDTALYPGQVSTGLCPEQTFAGEPIYADGAGADSAEVGRRVETYWRPYHVRIEEALAKIKAEHGFALLWDAHSIRGEVPRLFEGTLPELNFGTNGGKSCPDEILRPVLAAAMQLPYPAVANQRFKGGYITRHYGRPEESVYALQLEIAQRSYMDESTLRYDEARAGELAEAIKGLLTLFRYAAVLLDSRRMLDEDDG